MQALANEVVAQRDSAFLRERLIELGAAGAERVAPRLRLQTMGLREKGHVLAQPEMEEERFPLV